MDHILLVLMVAIVGSLLLPAMQIAKSRQTRANTRNQKKDRLAGGLSKFDLKC